MSTKEDSIVSALKEIVAENAASMKAIVDRLSPRLSPEQLAANPVHDRIAGMLHLRTPEEIAAKQPVLHPGYSPRTRAYFDIETQAGVVQALRNYAEPKDPSDWAPEFKEKVHASELVNPRYYIIDPKKHNSVGDRFHYPPPGTYAKDYMIDWGDATYGHQATVPFVRAQHLVTDTRDIVGKRLEDVVQYMKEYQDRFGTAFAKAEDDAKALIAERFVADTRIVPSADTRNDLHKPSGESLNPAASWDKPPAE